MDTYPHLLLWWDSIFSTPHRNRHISNIKRRSHLWNKLSLLHWLWCLSILFIWLRPSSKFGFRIFNWIDRWICYTLILLCFHWLMNNRTGSFLSLHTHYITSSSWVFNSLSLNQRIELVKSLHMFLKLSLPARSIWVLNKSGSPRTNTRWSTTTSN